MNFSGVYYPPETELKAALKQLLEVPFDDIPIYLDDEELTETNPPCCVVYSMSDAITERVPDSQIWRIPFGIEFETDDDAAGAALARQIHRSLSTFIGGILEDPAECDPSIRCPLAARLTSAEYATDDGTLRVDHIVDISMPAIQYNEGSISISITATALARLGTES